MAASFVIRETFAVVLYARLLRSLLSLRIADYLGHFLPALGASGIMWLLLFLLDRQFLGANRPSGARRQDRRRRPQLRHPDARLLPPAAPGRAASRRPAWRPAPGEWRMTAQSLPPNRPLPVRAPSAHAHGRGGTAPVASAPVEAGGATFTLGDLFAAILRHKLLVLVLTLAGALGGFAAAKRITRAMARRPPSSPTPPSSVSWRARPGTAAACSTPR